MDLLKTLSLHLTLEGEKVKAIEVRCHTRPGGCILRSMIPPPPFPCPHSCLPREHPSSSMLSFTLNPRSLPQCLLYVSSSFNFIFPCLFCLLALLSPMYARACGKAYICVLIYAYMDMSICKVLSI